MARRSSAQAASSSSSQPSNEFQAPPKKKRQKRDAPVSANTEEQADTADTAVDDEEDAGGEHGEPSQVKRKIERAIDKYRGWDKRDIIINNESYGVVLQALKEEYDLDFKEGRFEPAEVETVMKQVEIFKKTFQLDDSALRRVFYGRRVKDNVAIMRECVLEATTALNGTRPFPAVREFLKRQLRENAHQGLWTPEEDQVLRQSVEKHGNQWKKVAEDVGRTGEDCRKRLELLEKKANNPGTPKEYGAWSQDDVKTLIDSVERIKEEQAFDASQLFTPRATKQGFWKRVSEISKLPHPQEVCRMKFREMSRKRVRRTSRRWSSEDRVILLDRIMKQLGGVWSIEDDIQWSQLSDQDWNWKTNDLLNRWKVMKDQLMKKSDLGLTFTAQCEAMMKRAIKKRDTRQRRLGREGAKGEDADADEDAQTGMTSTQNASSSEVQSSTRRTTLGKRTHADRDDSSPDPLDDADDGKLKRGPRDGDSDQEMIDPRLRAKKGAAVPRNGKHAATNTRGDESAEDGSSSDSSSDSSSSGSDSSSDDSDSSSDSSSDSEEGVEPRVNGSQRNQRPSTARTASLPSAPSPSGSNSSGQGSDNSRDEDDSDSDAGARKLARIAPKAAALTQKRKEELQAKAKRTSTSASTSRTTPAANKSPAKAPASPRKTPSTIAKGKSRKVANLVPSDQIGSDEEDE